MSTRLEEIKVELDALYREVKSRPAAEVEQRISETATELIDAPGLPRFPFEALFAFRMTDADRRRETALIGEWNEIAHAIRVRRTARVQGKANAREVAKVRAAACPVCFSTHAGEC